MLCLLVFAKTETIWSFLTDDPHDIYFGRILKRALQICLKNKGHPVAQIYKEIVYAPHLRTIDRGLYGIWLILQLGFFKRSFCFGACLCKAGILCSSDFHFRGTRAQAKNSSNFFHFPCRKVAHSTSHHGEAASTGSRTLFCTTEEPSAIYKHDARQIHGPHGSTHQWAQPTYVSFFRALFTLLCYKLGVYKDWIGADWAKSVTNPLPTNWRIWTVTNPWLLKSDSIRSVEDWIGSD